MNSTTLFQIALEMWAAIFCVICGLSIFWGITKDSKNEKYLINTIFSITLLLIFDVLAYIYRGNVSRVGYYMVRISNFLCFALTYVSLYFVFCYVSHVIITRGGKIAKHIIRIYKWICAIYLVILSISQYTNLFYYYDEKNIYHRNDSFWMCNILGGILVAMYIHTLWKNRKCLSKREYLSFASYLFLPVIGMIVQTVIYGFSLLNLAMTASVILIYLQHMHSNAECLKDTVQKLEESNKVKDQFLQGISHEIRTPIHAILGFNSMLQDEKNLSEIKQNSIYVESASKHLLSMVNNILDYCALQNENIPLEEKAYLVEALLNDLIPYARAESKKKS